MMGVEAQWDEPRGSQAFGLASLRIPFDVFSDKTKRKALKGLDRRMLQPVIRDVDVVTSEADLPTETVPLLNQAGLAYQRALDVDVTDSSDPRLDLENELVANNDGETTVFFPITDGEIIELVQELDVFEHQTLAGADFAGMYESATLGRRSIAYNPGGATPGFRAVSGFADGSMINMAPDSEVNGVTLDGNGNSTFGLRIRTPGHRYVANSTIQNSAFRGIEARGDGADMTIVASRIMNSGDSGVWADEGAALTIDDSRIMNNGWIGVSASNGATINISNSYSGYNAAHGLSVENGDGVIVADHMLIEHNEQRGVTSNGDNSLIRITDSVIRRNDTGMGTNDISGINPTIIAERVLITENNRDGVEMFGGTVSITGSTISNNFDDGLKNFRGTLDISHSLVINNGDVGVGTESLGTYDEPQATTNLTNVIIGGNGWNSDEEVNPLFEGGYAVASTGDSIVTITDSLTDGTKVLLCDTITGGSLGPRFDYGTMSIDGVTAPGSGSSCAGGLPSGPIVVE